MSVEQDIVAAVFGFGRIGRIHYENLLQTPGVRVKYVVDAFPDIVTKGLGSRLPSDLVVLGNDQEDVVFSDVDVAFCVIGSPTFTHEGIIRKCIENGKHMFCEKPVAKSPKALVEVYKLAQQKKLILHCSFNRRFDPSFAEVKESIPDKVGSIYTVRTCSRDFPDPPIQYLRDSGGIFHDSCVHDIDVTCWLMGSYPQSVFATGAAQNQQIRDIPDFENVFITLRFPQERLALIEVGRHATYGYDQRFEQVNGAKGMLASNNVTDKAVTYSAGDGVTNAGIQKSFQERYASAYKESLRVFLAALRGDAESQKRIVSGDSVIWANRIATAAELSAKTGQVVAMDTQSASDL